MLNEDGTPHEILSQGIPEGEPATPKSSEPSSSSQLTSTARSRYKRRFDKNLLAPPVSSSPLPQHIGTVSSAGQSSAVANEHSPNRPSEQTRSRRQMEAVDYAVRAPSAAGASTRNDAELEKSPRPNKPHGQQASPGMFRTLLAGRRPHRRAKSDADPDDGSTGYHISPLSQPSTVSPSHGCEARHQAPVGINPSPPMGLPSAYHSHVLAPNEPTIDENPPRPPVTLLPPPPARFDPSNGEAVQSIHSRQRPKHSFRQFFRSKKHTAGAGLA